MRVPHPYASYLILQAIRETKGMAIAVDDEEIVSSMKLFLKMGVYACPEAASTLVALTKIEDEGVFDSDEKKLLYLTGNALKYFDVMELERDKIKVLSRNINSLS